jgi:diphthamide biosynthesis enzyme Dph1/Dph2-like protein
MAFEIVQNLKKKNEGAKFYVLYDSLKKSCCTDILGAEHVGYDCLFHFG